MANNNPNTQGLRPFNQLTPEEQKAIRSAGGKASAAKRRRLKIQNEIIDNIRKQFKYDPIALGYYSLFKKLEGDALNITDTIRVIEYFERKRLSAMETIDEITEQLSDEESFKESMPDIESNFDTEITRAKYAELHPFGMTF